MMASTMWVIALCIFWLQKETKEKWKKGKKEKSEKGKKEKKRKKGRKGRKGKKGKKEKDLPVFVLPRTIRACQTQIDNLRQIVWFIFWLETGRPG